MLISALQQGWVPLEPNSDAPADARPCNRRMLQGATSALQTATTRHDSTGRHDRTLGLVAAAGVQGTVKSNCVPVGLTNPFSMGRLGEPTAPWEQRGRSHSAPRHEPSARTDSEKG